MPQAHITRISVSYCAAQTYCTLHRSTWLTGKRWPNADMGCHRTRTFGLGRLQHLRKNLNFELGYLECLNRVYLGLFGGAGKELPWTRYYEQPSLHMRKRGTTTATSLTNSLQELRHVIPGPGESFERAGRAACRFFLKGLQKAHNPDDSRAPDIAHTVALTFIFCNAIAAENKALYCRGTRVQYTYNWLHKTVVGFTSVQLFLSVARSYLLCQLDTVRNQVLSTLDLQLK